jgi:hypothetical protein
MALKKQLKKALNREVTTEVLKHGVRFDGRADLYINRTTILDIEKTVYHKNLTRDEVFDVMLEILSREPIKKEKVSFKDFTRERKRQGW